MTQTWKKIATVSLAAVMLTGSLAGCGQQAVSIDKENPSINVMTKAYNTESASPDSPVLQKLEEFLGTKLNITWVPSTSYDEKVIHRLCLLVQEVQALSRTQEQVHSGMLQIS